MTKNVEFIRKYNPTPCYHCDGWGFMRRLYPGISAKERKARQCPVCKGTGKWNEDTFDLIATQPDGQKIAFRVDNIK